METSELNRNNCQGCGAPLLAHGMICPVCDISDEPETPEELAEPSQLKASTILYVAAAAFLFLGVMLPIGEMMVRPGVRPDTLVEMLEWNPFSQLGVVGIIQGLFLFLLGLMTDRRGA